MTPTHEEHLAVAISQLRGLGEDMQDVKTSMRQLTDAVTKLAVMEERQISDRTALARAFKEIERHEIRLTALEVAQPVQKQATEWVHKTIWLLAAAAIGAVSAGAIHIKVERAQAAQEQRAQL